MSSRYRWIAAIVGCLGAGASAEIVVDHTMNRNNAWHPSDTMVYQEGTWALTADNFSLADSATVRHVGWYGCYYSDVEPSQETSRIRIYSARESDGLPGDVLWEESVTNPARASTGRLVQRGQGKGGMLGEYRYDVDLAGPFTLQASTPYWFEVAEVGDADSQFCWVGANVDDNNIAVMTTNYPNWGRGGIADMAFELSTIPEPMTAVLLVVGGALVGTRKECLSSK